MDSIVNDLEKELVSEIVVGNEIRYENNALMVTKELIYEYKNDKTTLGVVLYPFQKKFNAYENYLQIQLYPKNHSLWHRRKLFILNDFTLILQLSKKFPNNYYLFDYLFTVYERMFNNNNLTDEFLQLINLTRQRMDHSSLWCFYRCGKLHTNAQQKLISEIHKMAKYQFNIALENIILALYVEFENADLEPYLVSLFRRRKGYK